MTLLGRTFNPHENDQVDAQNYSGSNDVTRWRKGHPSEHHIADKGKKEKYRRKRPNVGRCSRRFKLNSQATRQC